MRVLIVGPLDGQIAEAGKIVWRRGSKVAHVDSVAKAMSLLRSGKGAELVMIDASESVKDMVLMLQQERIHVPVVACGIGVDAKTAVDAIKAGAKEYMPLPPDAELIASILEAVASDDSELVVRDALMQDLITMADQIAPSEASVLITGESGTGKEMIARYVHKKSKRSNGPFISVNCAAIPENLLESELFGHEKGAFTGATARRIGKFEESSGGTLLLDEISEMHPRLQAKLLRAIQEKEIDRIGGNQTVKVDIRLLATSNRDLEEEVRLGNFREDLYFRLNVVALCVPPLRDRPKDILCLSEFFIKKYCKLNGLPQKFLTDSAMHTLQNYTWKGNVRELENTIHRAVLLSKGDDIGVAALNIGTSVTKKNSTDFVGKTVADVERDLIMNTLDHCLGNRTQAATILGISIRTLRNKLKQYSSDIPEFENDQKSKIA